jgi:hypothetical protein
MVYLGTSSAERSYIVLNDRLIMNKDVEVYTYAMHFLFCLLIIKGLCMFRELLALSLEVLHKRHLVYCVQSWRHHFHSNPVAAN